MTTLDGRRTEGRVVRLDSEALRVAAVDGSQNTVARVDVRSLEMARMRTGTYAKRGALAGAVGGGVLGGVFLSDFCSGSTTCGAATDLYIVGGGIVAGALAGTLIGSLVGWAASDWVQVRPEAWGASYRRPDLALVPSHVVSLPALHLSVRMPLPN